MLNEELKNGSHEGRLVQIHDEDSEHNKKKGVIVYSAGKGTHHTVHDRFGNSFGFHPSKNLTSTENLTEESEPIIGSKVKAIRGSANGRIQTIAADSKGVKKAYVQTDDGRVIATPLDNIQLESATMGDILSKVRRIIAESKLLLEYNEEKTWTNYGSKISDRMAQEGHPTEKHSEIFHATVNAGDPTKNKEYGKWIAQRYSEGGINKLEDVATRIKPALEKFHDHKKKGTLATHGVEADIGKYKTIADLTTAAAKLPEKAVTETGEAKAKKAAAINSSMRHLAGENEHWQHFALSNQDESKEPVKHEESRFIVHQHGDGTGGDTKHPAHCEWCTAANGESSKETMNDYLKEGDLHIMIPKKPTHSGERYQIHHESDSQMDEKDNTADLHKTFEKRPWPNSYQNVLEGHLNRILGQ